MAAGQPPGTVHHLLEVLCAVDVRLATIIHCAGDSPQVHCGGDTLHARHRTLHAARGTTAPENPSPAWLVLLAAGRAAAWVGAEGAVAAVAKAAGADHSPAPAPLVARTRNRYRVAGISCRTCAAAPGIHQPE